MIYVIESMVINWTHQIRDVLKEDSRTFLQKGSNLGPNAEYEFWKSRKENMQSIYEQVCLSVPKIIDNISIETLSSELNLFSVLASESCYSEDGGDFGGI